MLTLARVIALLSLLSFPLVAQVTVFWQPGFPTIASQPVSRATLSSALNDPAFVDLRALQAPGALRKPSSWFCPMDRVYPPRAGGPSRNT